MTAYPVMYQGQRWRVTHKRAQGRYLIIERGEDFKVVAAQCVQSITEHKATRPKRSVPRCKKCNANHWRFQKCPT